MIFVSVLLDRKYPQCTVGHHVWLSQEKLFVTDLGHTILIFAAKCRVIQLCYLEIT